MTKDAYRPGRNKGTKLGYLFGENDNERLLLVSITTKENM